MEDVLESLGEKKLDTNICASIHVKSYICICVCVCTHMHIHTEIPSKVTIIMSLLSDY